MKITEKLPAAFKKKWLKALKSGKYIKGTGLLKQIDNGETKWCCLGVAGDICGVKNFGSSQYLFSKSNMTDKRSSLRGLANVPKTIRGHWEDSVAEKLAKLNDNSKSFDKVIKWIEKNL
jgi:hypothetical protein